MVRIIKPKRFAIFDNRKTKYTMSYIKTITGCDDIINGGFFGANLKPLCHLKIDGIVQATDKYKYWGYAFNDSMDDFVMTQDYRKFDNYISCVEMIRDGKIQTMYYNKDVGGRRGRSAIGVRADGTMVMACSKDGTSFAMTPEQLQAYMLSQGCKTAIMLDGGGSCQGDFMGVKVTSSRIVSNFILVWEDRTFIPEGKEPTRDIKNPMKGDDCKWVQSMLQRTGQLIGVGGDFGPKSAECLKNFQKYWGLKQDGICGPKTVAALKDCVDTLENCKNKALRAAVKEIGRTEKAAQDDKFIYWYNAETGANFNKDTTPWCAIFASWCMRRGGIDKTKYPTFASCSVGLAAFEKNGVARDPKNYVPNPGDLIMFDWENDGKPNHVGMVFKVSGGNVETIEGNTSDAVYHKTYPLNSKSIFKYIDVLE